MDTSTGTLSFKKIFLISMIASFSIGALIGIIIFLVGNFGHTELRILLTTAVIGGASLTGLCNAVLFDRHRFEAVAIIGIILSFFGLMIVLPGIWSSVDSEVYWKLVATVGILSASFAQIALLLLINSEKTSVNVSLSMTIIFVLLVAAELIVLVITEFSLDSMVWYRILGVLAILDSLGSIVTPILHKVTSIE